MTWLNHVKQLNSIMNGLSVFQSDDAETSIDKAFLLWEKTTLSIREEKKTIFLIGNGASASMASHVAADLAKNARLRTEVFSDLSLITAFANDMGYENVFAEPLRRHMCIGDMLVAISSSGQSPNVIRAVEEANNLGGFVVTLSAMKRENKLRSMGMLNFYVPADTYGDAETCHAAILHYWIDQTIIDQA
ncbi:MAG: SIS domain-containing protein [Deltaproteobacteria bacterium]